MALGGGALIAALAVRKNKITPFLFLIVSFGIVARAQPDWSPFACVLTSCLGYALFWKGALTFPKKSSRFGLSVLWFGALSAIHLNWFFADRYMGGYIYLFLAILFFGLGVQFALMTLLIGDPKQLKGWAMLGLSGGWALLEWSRLFILSGYSFDPIGIALSGTVAGMQVASAVGIYGLSFLVFFTNLIALKWFSLPSKRHFFQWSIILLIPYLLGGAHLLYYTQRLAHFPQPPLKTLLIQTALYPEDKVPFKGSKPYSPLDQWRRILTLLAPHIDSSPELIVLPEGAVPYGTHAPIYPREELIQAFKEILGKELLTLPDKQRLCNGNWAQALADVTGADILAGLEDGERSAEESRWRYYNAAFLFRPLSESYQRYEKRVLVPMGEYIPFEWCKKILSKYGIMDSYTPGKGALVFPLVRTRAGISICYEETFGYLMRESRLKGASLLVNLTNDVWFPKTRLPRVHFFHGRLRAIELGVPLLRSCNTGVTCAVDSLGRIVGELPCETAHHSSSPAVLATQLPLYHYPTLYAFWGDLPLISSAALLFMAFLVINYFKLKKLAIKSFFFYSLRKNKAIR